MTPTDSRLLRVLEDRKSHMLRTAEGWPLRWLTYNPAPDTWCVLQIFDHLIRTEQSVRQAIERNLSRKARRVSLPERLRANLFLLFFRSPVRVRVPDQASFVLPGHPESLEDIHRLWAHERCLLHELLAGQNQRSLRLEAIKHPVAGALSLQDTLRFLETHLRHHEFQLQRVRKAVARAIPIPPA